MWNFQLRNFMSQGSQFIKDFKNIDKIRDSQRVDEKYIST